MVTGGATHICHVSSISNKTMYGIMNGLQTIVAPTNICHIRQPSFVAKFCVCWICLKQVKISLAVRSLIVVELRSY